MIPRPSHLPLVVFVTPPLAGVVVGAAFAMLFPPDHPDDRVFTWILGAGGLGMIGLLFGFLGWLLLRGRMTPLIAICALAVPASAFGSFINGKSGRWDVAWWFGLAGFVVALVFLVRSLDLIAHRDRDARRG